jgi:hypothetical protein
MVSVGTESRVKHNKTPTDSGLRPYPSAFCVPSASGIAPVRFRLAMNVHPLCLKVNTLLTGSRRNILSEGQACYQIAS